MTTSVFCTSTRTPTAGSTRDSASTASTAWKNVAPAPPKRLGNLDAHDAELEQPGQQARVERGLLVHLADERAGFPATAKSKTVSWKSRSSSESVVRADGGAASGLTTAMLSSRKRTAGMQRSPHARLARWLRPAGVAACLAALALAGVRPAAQQAAAPQPAPQGQPSPRADRPAGRTARARRPGARGRTRRARHSRPGRAGDLPRRHQLRARGRHRHRRQGAARHRSQAGRLRGLRRQPAAVGRAVPPDQGGRQPEAGRPAAARDPQPRRRGDRGGARRRPHLRHPARRLPRAALQLGVGARAAHALHPDAAAAQRHDRGDVSAHAGLRRVVHARPRRRSSAPSTSSRAASTTTGRRTSSRRTTSAIRPRRSSASATTS